MKEKEQTKKETCALCSYKNVPNGCFRPCSVCRNGNKFQISEEARRCLEDELRMGL